MHRGRFQAQGAGVEESERWAQDDPLSAGSARRLLEALELKLTPRELFLREQAFTEARQFVDRAETAGGVGVTRKSYPQVPRRDSRRVDIEVSAGRAFVRT